MNKLKLENHKTWKVANQDRVAILFCWTFQTQSNKKDNTTTIKNDQYIKSWNNEHEFMLNKIGINIKNSISYSINNNAIIKKPKLILTRNACVEVKPHS